MIYYDIYIFIISYPIIFYLMYFGRGDGHGMAMAWPVLLVCAVCISAVSQAEEKRGIRADGLQELLQELTTEIWRYLETSGDIWRWKLRKKERKWTETNGNDGYSQSMDLKDLNILYGDLAIKRLLSEHFEILQVTLQNILKSQLYTPRPNLPWSWTCVGCRKSMTSSGAALFDTQLVVTQRCRKL